MDFRTERLTAERLSPGHLEDLTALHRDPEAMRQMMRMSRAFGLPGFGGADAGAGAGAFPMPGVTDTTPGSGGAGAAAGAAGATQPAGQQPSGTQSPPPANPFASLFVRIDAGLSGSGLSCLLPCSKKHALLRFAI